MGRDALTPGLAWGLLAAALVALAGAVVPALQERGAEWRVLQRRHAALTGRPAPGVIETAPRGAPERCPTCHLDVAAGAAAAGRPRPFGPHPGILAHHPVERDGCVACHGGAGRALDRAHAHATGGPAELRRGPLLAAGCPRCHAPGSVAADRPVRDGLTHFVDLGCITCHRAGRLDAASDFGPDLSAIGLRGSAELRRAVRRPSRLFPGTMMPDFEPVLAAPGVEDALLAYLLSLRGAPPARPANDALSAIPCALCHGGGGGVSALPAAALPAGAAGAVAAPPAGPDEAASRPAPGAHRCAFIRDHRAELACRRCHARGVPPGGRECAYVAKRRFICGACHEAGQP